MAKRKRSTFERLQRGERLSRRERKQIERQFQAEEPGWEIVHRNVAGIDVGNESHFVSVDPRQTDQPVREFGSWTAGLHQMVDWLKTSQVQRVVLQTTGVYWIPVQDVLEKAGFEVAVVDARAPGTCLDGKATYRSASGYGSWISMDCCGAVSRYRTVSALFVPSGVYGNGG
jgi:hypothetical protein